MVSLTYPYRRCSPLADAIHAQYRRVIEWAGKKGGRRMGLVVFRKQQRWKLGDPAGGQFGHFLLKQGFQIELFLEPDWHGLNERAESFGSVRKIGFQQA